MSDSTQTITGVIVRYNERAKGWMELLLDRGPANKYEMDHPERAVVPLEVSPYVAKGLVLTPGLVIEADYLLTGREYNTKHYVSASVQAVRIADGQPREYATERTPAMAEPLPEDRQDTAEDSQALPF